MRSLARWMVLLLLLAVRDPLLAADLCEVCGASIEGTVYFWQDRVANVKKRVCPKCSALPTSCYMCSVPVIKDYTELPDGRILCHRDARTVVLTDDEAARICEDTRRALERQFSRFISFPERNVTIALVDRVNLMNLFQIPGRDYECPNVLGYLYTKTNVTPTIHEMSLLSGLPAETLKSTYAHEITHAWVAENLSIPRRKRINRNAEEGFCELVAYLHANQQGDEASKKSIKLNGYTRGQFDLFLAAESKYGFNEVTEWMIHGEDSLLMADDLSRIRRVNVPVATNSPPTITYAAKPPSAPPEKLILKGVMWSAKPTAVINDRTFMVNDENKVRLGSSNVTVRCVAIQPDAVVISVNGSTEKQTLTLRR